MLKTLQNDRLLQRQAEQTFEDIALNPRWSYQHFIKRVDKEIEEIFGAKLALKRRGSLDR